MTPHEEESLWTYSSLAVAILDVSAHEVRSISYVQFDWSLSLILANQKLVFHMSSTAVWLRAFFNFFPVWDLFIVYEACVYNLLYSDVSRKTQVTLWIWHELLIFWIEIPSAVSHFFAKCGDWTIEIERTGHVDWDSNDICGRWRFSGAEKSSWG